jgi:hypothetical protein
VTTKSTTKYTRAWAAKLTREIREGFLNVEKRIGEFIKGGGWTLLGYDTFTAWWNKEMDGVRLATTLARARAVEAMFEDGADDKAVMNALGMGDEVVRRAREDFEESVPPEHMTLVRQHPRGLPTKKHFPILDPGPRKLAKYTQLTEQLGSNLREQGLLALDAHFSKLEAALRERSVEATRRTARSARARKSA